MKVLLANPRGFCAGVDRAIAIVNRALDSLGAPIYVKHEVVHNRFVVETLKKRGAIFVDQINEVPENSTVIYSAHGVSQAVRKEANERNLKIFDATCPLVTKVHIEVARNCRQGKDVVLIGHAGHPEVEGTLGQWDQSVHGNVITLIENVGDVSQLQMPNPDNIAYVSQTTLSVDDTRSIIEALKAKFPQIEGPARDDICYATQNRQDAVRTLASQCDLILVVGSPNSSNSNRLRELADKQGIKSHLINDAGSIDPSWLEAKQRIGVTAGASAPETLVQDVLSALRNLGASEVQEIDGQKETVFFSLPKELR